MKGMVDKIGRYFEDVLGIKVAAAPWPNVGSMPLFLRDRYQFFRVEILTQRCLFMVDTYAEEDSPAAIRKQVEQVREKWGDPVVYVRDRVTAYNRKRLITHKVPFIVPGAQMYLPMLGIDLREHFRKLRHDRRNLGPAAQVVLIDALLREQENLGPTALARKLGYSIMAMSRALDELDATGLGQTAVNGRERRLCLAGSKREVWEKAQPLLRTPVVRRQMIHLAPSMKLSGPRAGLDALAHYSMLAEPANIEVALTREDWKMLRQTDGVEPAVIEEPETTTVEIWNYAPTLFAEGGWVDRLSLYLSLRETQDERVQAALDQIIKALSW